MNNKIFSTFILVLLVVAGLFALYCLPAPFVGDKKLRHVDILSDVRPDVVLPVGTDLSLIHI